MKNEVTIKPDMLTWAIDRAGFDLEDFVITKFPKVQAWLDNKKKPTLKQLEDFSRKVYLPFGYLFLPEPPLEKMPIPLFRTNAQKQTSKRWALNVLDTISLLQRRQDWLVEYLLTDQAEPLRFVGKYTLGSGDAVKIAADIRTTLGLQKEWATYFSTWERALDHLTMQIEEAGIIVNFNSVVGNNNHRPIKVDECRGFVLVDPIAPFMFVNSADSKAAQMFTLAHELAHIWLGESAGFDFSNLQPANDPLELLCDKIAAELLVPSDTFNIAWMENPDFKFLAKKFKVSPIVAGRRALDLGKIDKATFFNFYYNYMNQFQEKKDNQINDGGNFYATQKKRLSIRFMAYLNRAVKENKVLYRDAYSLTGLTGNTYQNFISQYL